ncbi:phosphatidate cytidylyltransferase [Rhodobacteraceae bacterium KMM 6894]|nr:phosphatidate cytidylyltransferase [Rhodobacteraceae bacterium KMM 6894]
MSGNPQWADLAPRLISAVVMVVVGIVGLWLGGLWFAVGLWALGGVMMWELSRMIGAPDLATGRAVMLGGLGAGALALASVLPGMTVLPLLIAAAVVGAGQMPANRVTYGCFAAATLLACHAMIVLRDVGGLGWILWVICVVVASDVAGYFAGRTLGGPKFWPAISPKKTWSGTIAGWLGAAVIGLIFAVVLNAGVGLALVSVAVALAGQMGDIWESWIKRKMGIKDSSNLIPGHGGVLDRFDAMLGAALLASLLWALGWIPGLV